MPNHIQSNIQSPQDAYSWIQQDLTPSCCTAAPPAAAYLILNIALIDFGSACFSNVLHIFRISWKLLSLSICRIKYIYSFINEIIQVCGYKCGSLMLWCLVLSTQFLLQYLGFAELRGSWKQGLSSGPPELASILLLQAPFMDDWSWVPIHTSNLQQLNSRVMVLGQVVNITKATYIIATPKPMMHPRRLRTSHHEAEGVSHAEDLRSTSVTAPLPWRCEAPQRSQRGRGK